MISFTIPGVTKSTANLREHHMAKARRIAAARRKAMTLCPKWQEGALLVVTLTRYGVRELDSDNLAGALKGERDGIASRLGVDDGSRLVRWEYAQATCAKGEERVVVKIRALPRTARTPDEALASFARRAGVSSDDFEAWLKSWEKTR